MRKCRRLVNCMVIAILLSSIIIFLCECEQFENINLLGERESIKNIFIGIFGSSVVSLIGYILDYFQVIKNIREDVEFCYMNVRTELFTYIDGKNKEMLLKIRKSDMLLQMREISGDYKKILDFYLGLLNFINKFRKENVDKFELLDCNFCSKYVKAAFVITILHNHFLILNRNLLCKNIWLIEYKKQYESTKKENDRELINDIKLYSIKKQYKFFIESDKKEKNYIESLKLNEKCKNLDSLFVFGVLK